MRKIAMNGCLTLLLSVGLSAEAVSADVAEEFTAEHRDFFHLFRAPVPEIALGASYQPSTQEESGSAEFDRAKWYGKFEIPIPTATERYLRFGGEYEQGIYDFKDADDGETAVSSKTLHRIVLHAGYGFFLNPDLLLTGIASPGIFSDLDGSVDENDFDMQGNALIVYRFNPGAQLIAGVRVGEEYDDWPVLPLAGIRLLSEDGSTHISVTLPLEARVGYYLDPSTELYTGLWVTGDEYQAELGPDDTELNIQVQDRRIGGGARFLFSDHLSLSIEGGVALQSEFDFEAEQTNHFRGDVDPTGYIALQLGIRL